MQVYVSVLTDFLIVISKIGSTNLSEYFDQFDHAIGTIKINPKVEEKKNISCEQTAEM